MGNTAPVACQSCGQPVNSEPDDHGEEPLAKVSENVSIVDYSKESPLIAEVEEEPEDPFKSQWVLPAGGKLTVMMFGMTGAGKSSLGNLLAGGPVFESGDDTASVTNLDSVMRFEAPDHSFILLDTIGLGDTEIEQDKVVGSIRDVALSAPAGIDVLLFVMRHARITDDAIARLIYVTEYLWGQECLLNLYVVVTCASRYVKKKEEAVEWIDRQVELNWRFKHIYKLVGNNPNRFIFVDNPDPLAEEPETKERQFASRENVMKAMALHPRDVVPPFTHAMMRKAQSMTEEQERELAKTEKELRDLGDDNSEESREMAAQDGKLGPVSTKKATPKKAAAKSKTEKTKKPETEVDRQVAELREKRALARQKREEAEQALRKRLEEVKASAEFQESAANVAALATERFKNDYVNVADNGKTASGGTTGPVSACKKMIGTLGRKMRISMREEEIKPAKPAKAPTPAESVKQSADYRQFEVAESVEKTLDAIVTRLRNMLRAGARETFVQLTGSSATTLSPVAFQMFLNSMDPDIERHQAGGLWRRGDANCDGQLDVAEFCNLFGGGPLIKTPPPQAKAKAKGRH